MRAAIKKPLTRTLRESGAKGLGGDSTTKDTIPQPRPVSSQAGLASMSTTRMSPTWIDGGLGTGGAVPDTEIDLTPAVKLRRCHGLVAVACRRGRFYGARRGAGYRHSLPGAFTLDQASRILYGSLARTKI